MKTERMNEILPWKRVNPHDEISNATVYVGPDIVFLVQGDRCYRLVTSPFSGTSFGELRVTFVRLRNHHIRMNYVLHGEGGYLEWRMRNGKSMRVPKGTIITCDVKQEVIPVMKHEVVAEML